MFVEIKNPGLDLSTRVSSNSDYTASRTAAAKHQILTGLLLLAPVKNGKNDPLWFRFVKRLARTLSRRRLTHLEPKTYLSRYFAEPQRFRILVSMG